MDGLHGACYLIVLCGSGLLCGLCSGLILKEYKRI
jgi:hypothetical protein